MVGLARGVERSFALEGRVECVVDCTLELATLVTQLYASIILFERKRAWVVQLHQLALITAESLVMCPQTARLPKVLVRLGEITKNMGEWLLGKNQTLVAENELLNLNADFVALVAVASNLSDLARREANRLGFYATLKQVLLYALKGGLRQQQVCVNFAQEQTVLRVWAPTRYEMQKEGVFALTPELFRHAYAADRASWNLEQEMGRIGAVQCSNPFVDAICRFLVSAVQAAQTSQSSQTSQTSQSSQNAQTSQTSQTSSINVELFRELVSVFFEKEGSDGMKVFEAATRSYAQLVLMDMLVSMCKLQPSLYTECVRMQLDEELTRPSFLAKLATEQFQKAAEGDLVVCSFAGVSHSEWVTLKRGRGVRD